MCIRGLCINKHWVIPVYGEIIGIYKEREETVYANQSVIIQYHIIAAEKQTESQKQKFKKKEYTRKKYNQQLPVKRNPFELQQHTTKKAGKEQKQDTVIYCPESDWFFERLFEDNTLFHTQI